MEHVIFLIFYCFLFSFLRVCFCSLRFLPWRLTRQGSVVPLSPKNLNYDQTYVLGLILRNPRDTHCILTGHFVYRNNTLCLRGTLCDGAYKAVKFSDNLKMDEETLQGMQALREQIDDPEVKQAISEFEGQLKAEHAHLQVCIVNLSRCLPPSCRSSSIRNRQIVWKRTVTTRRTRSTRKAMSWTSAPSTITLPSSARSTTRPTSTSW